MLFCFSPLAPLYLNVCTQSLIYSFPLTPASSVNHEDLFYPAVIIIYLPHEWWHVAWGAAETEADECTVYVGLPAEHPGRPTPP